MDEKTFQEYVNSYCWSIYEGCCCRKEANHEGKHSCDWLEHDTWTDEQSKEWIENTYKEINNE